MAILNTSEQNFIDKAFLVEALARDFHVNYHDCGLASCIIFGSNYLIDAIDTINRKDPSRFDNKDSILKVINLYLKDIEVRNNNKKYLREMGI